MLRHFIHIFNSVCTAPHPYGFVSLQDSTQNLEDGEVMMTELLTSPKTKDALRYSLYANKNIIFILI